MIDFANMPLFLKCFIYPLTTISTIITLLFIGKFFCVSTAEKMYDEVNNNNGEALISMMACTIFFCIVWWGAWMFQIGFLVFVMSIFSAVLMLVDLLIFWYLLFNDGNPVLKFFNNIHNKIYERKHGVKK